MKKIYSLLLICYSISISAQLTEINHAPAAGNNFELYDCDPANINPGASGAGTQWTFSGATTTVAPLAYQTLTVNNPLFPNAKVGVAASATNTAYYSSDQNSLFYHGGNIPIPQVVAEFNYAQPAIKAIYPMSLGSTSAVAISGTVTVTSPFPTTGTFTGNSKTICDGTGTLTVAGTTVTNIYRVVTTQTIYFTAATSGTLMQENFDYYEPDTKVSLFTISSTTLLALMQTNTLVSVSRLKSYVGTGINELVNAAPMRIYPNPALSEIKVLSPEKDFTLNIFDITGKLVSTVTLNKGVNRMDVSGYVKGLYVYKIEDKEGTVKSTGKLTIIQ